MANLQHPHKKDDKSLLAVSFVFSLLAAALAGTSPARAADSGDDAAALTGMNLEDLMKIQVSSASRKSQNMAETAAAVYVIGQEDIRRAGVTTIADALRLAPGLQVARDTANSLAITARGFNGRYANKLLVLMDGRSVYTPIFSGVFWDLQDTVLEDIERIEVIRGPGAAMWGANAVNGVINIITKPARKTQGNLLVAGGGNQERAFGTYRYGGQSSDNTYYRAYIKGFERKASLAQDDRSNDDGWHSAQAGFRVDSAPSAASKVTLQGDFYRMAVGETVRSNTVLTPPYSSAYATDDQARGGNLLARWENRQSATSETVVQTYYDSVRFTAPKLSTQTDTFDLDFQQRWRPDATHDLVWGANYRHVDFAVRGASEIAFATNRQARDNFGIFAQDDIALIQERLRLTLGAKMEHSAQGGSQFQPNGRLLWTPDGDQSVWLAASRAARTPSLGESSARIDYSVTAPSPASLGLPVATVIQGSGSLRSEKLSAYELGYRTRLTPSLTADLSFFANRYRNLIALRDAPMTLNFAPVPHLVLPLSYYNEAGDYQTRGAEVVADWKPLPWMRLEGSYTWLKMQARPIGEGLGQDDIAGNSPRYQATLRWQMDLGRRTQIDFWLRHIDRLPHPDNSVSPYTALDLRIGWKARKDLDLSLVGQNLLDSRHVEFSSSFAATSQMPRSLFLKATLNF